MKTTIAIGLLYVSILVAAFVGWSMNIYKFVKSDFEKPVATEVIRGVGIVVTPIGAISGYMTLGDE